MKTQEKGQKNLQKREEPEKFQKGLRRKKGGVE